MTARLRVGVLGLAHDHVWPNLRALGGGEQGVLVAAADPDKRLRERLAGEFSGVELHVDYDALLDRRDLDAVFVYADNRGSAELAVRALERGLPVMLEKPMAADLAGAEALLAAGRRGGRQVMVNWPSAWRPAVRHALQLVHQKVIGEPIQVSHRGGHAGPRAFGCSEQFCHWLYDASRNGGGALVDYAGYGALLCRALLGQPLAVAAVTINLRTPDLAAEDNAVVVLHFPRALGLLEASWTQVGSRPAYGMIVYGESGTLLVHQPKAAREGEAAEAGRTEVAGPDGSRFVDPPPLPEGERDGPSYFLARVRADQPIEGLCSPEVGRDVQEVLQAAFLSAVDGRLVPLPLESPGPTPLTGPNGR